MAKRPTKKRAVDPGDTRAHADAPGDYALALAPSTPSPAPTVAGPAPAAELVEAGARWLDRQAPGWFIGFDADAADIRSDELLGLAFGGGYWGWIQAVRNLCGSVQVLGEKAVGWKAGDPGALVRHGFAAGDVPPSEGFPFRYVELNQAWKWAIFARQQGIVG